MDLEVGGAVDRGGDVHRAVADLVFDDALEPSPGDEILPLAAAAALAVLARLTRSRAGA